MKTQIKIGTIGYPVNEPLLYPHVDVVELQVTRRSVPKSAVGKKIREKAPTTVQFTIQMPAVFFEPPDSTAKLNGDLGKYGGFQISDEHKRLFERLNRFADNLQSDTYILLTPSDFTPTPKMQENLARFLDEMPVGDRTIVWQPSGPWTDTQTASFAKTHRLTLALDPLRDEAPAGASAYFRLGPFAVMGSRVGIYDLERILEAAARFDKATVVFETDRALDDVRNLKQVLAENE